MMGRFVLFSSLKHALGWVVRVACLLHNDSGIDPERRWKWIVANTAAPSVLWWDYLVSPVTEVWKLKPLSNWKKEMAHLPL